jgi:hypothetical protein
MPEIMQKSRPPVNNGAHRSNPTEAESMLTIAQVLALVSLVALGTALVTSHTLFAWVCSGVSGVGVLLLIVDAIRDRHERNVPHGQAG